MAAWIPVLLICYRHSDGERSTLTNLGFHSYFPVMFHDNPVADAQTEPGAFTDFFSGEEWVEDTGQNLLFNPAPVITENDIDVIIDPLRGYR
jgi:galactose mutarotase-like enzyme